MRFLFLVLFAVLLCCGCGPSKPAGIPKLAPASVTIVKGSTPVVGANVFFVPREGTESGSWSIAGVTDATGLAQMETSLGDWKALGVPEGEYRIYLTKLGQIEEPEVPADMETNSEAKENYYKERLARLEAASKEIPKRLTNDATSDLKIAVSGAETNETFDISQYDE